jgi:hypothetical protein
MRWLCLVVLLACAAPPAHPVYPEVAAAAPGRGPLVAVVFASWCRHCRDELALLAEIRAERPGLRIVGLNAYEDWEGASNQEKLAIFLAENAPWLPVVRADDAMLEALGGVPKIPSLFLFSSEGKLVEAYRRQDRQPPGKKELLRRIDSM